jgi:hypothetical protein
MADPILVGKNEVKFLMDGNTRALGLGNNAYTPSGSGTKAQQYQGVDYIVPVGKKFCILSISWNCTYAGGSGIDIGYGVGAATPYYNIASFALLGNVGSGGNQMQNLDFYSEIPAGNYITQTSRLAGVIIFGVETDA